MKKDPIWDSLMNNVIEHNNKKGKGSRGNLYTKKNLLKNYSS